MTYLNQHDIIAWNNLSSTEYSLEQIEPIRLIAEALDERCAVVGVNIDSRYHVVPGDWPTQTTFDAIHDKIFELLPYFLRMDFDDIRECTGVSNYDRYRTQQFTTILKYSSIMADLRDHNANIHPQQMDSELSDVTNAANSFYRACKYLIDKMYAVDVTEYTFLSNVFNSTVEFEEEWQGNHSIKRYSSYIVNSQELTGTHTIDEMASRLAGLNRNVSSRNFHCNHEWYTVINYSRSKHMDEYQTVGGQYAAGDDEEIYMGINYTDHPGLCRCQNPSPIIGNLHMIMQPARRLESVHNYQVIDNYTTDPHPDYNYDWINVKADRDITETKYGYDYFSGDLKDASMKTKRVVTKPGYDPLRDNISSTTVDTYWNSTGSEITKFETYQIGYRDYPMAGSNFTDYWAFYAHDGHGIWDSGNYDRDFGLIGGYKIKDVYLGNNIKNPSWIDIDQIIHSDVPAGWIYWDYRRDIDIELNVSQKALAYIDYRVGFKYKAE